MKPRVTRFAWMGLGGSAALCAAVLAASRQFRPARLVGDPVLASLLAEKSSLRSSDDTTLTALRRQWMQAHEHAWNAAKLRELMTELNGAWTSEVPSVPTGLALQPIVLTRTRVPLEDWPAVRAALSIIEQKPGVALTSLEVTAEGVGAARVFQRVSLTLGVVWPDATAVNAEPAPASPAPRFAAPGEPAGAREVGARPAGADSPRDRAGQPLL